ncbi:MAG: TIM barrel protein [Clostridiales bacterium]|nr:TIM barrel protein [Clostridiales bacterium]
MKLGLNLSFAVKRWMLPKELAALCKSMGAKYIQFTWDLCDPWWPEAQRDPIARAYADAFAREGLVLTGTFGGLAAYTYPQLLAPMEEMRRAGVQFFKRAIDMTRVMGLDVIGTPLGGMDAMDSNDPARRQERYDCALDLVREIAQYGYEKGLREIQVEATPLATEFPHSPEASLKLMKDLEGTTAIPVRLLIDWGHAMFKPLLKEQADMELWLKTLKPYVSAIHLQQCDGQWDRHWDFTHEGGIITPELIRTVTKNSGAEDIIQYLEVVTIFEDTDEHVLDGMTKTMKMLQEVFEK